MKKLFFSVLTIFLLLSCNNKKGNMVVNGNITGLKKGTVYLQKIKDTVLVAVDSVKLNGNSDFILTDEVESPEMYYITLNEKSGEKIPFFGEKGNITLSSKLDKLATSAKISGSVNDSLLGEYKSMIQKFNGKQLDLLKEKFDAQKSENANLVSELETKEASLIKRKYYYSTNFAITHPDYEVAPYVALTELYNANIKLLDTINNSLTPRNKASKYGKELNKFISEIKATEKEE